MAESVDALELIALARTSLRDTVLPQGNCKCIGDHQHGVTLLS